MTRPAHVHSPARMPSRRPNTNGRLLRPRALRPQARPEGTPWLASWRSRHCFLLALFAIAQMLFFSSKLFKVHDIKVMGNTTVPSQKVIESTGLHTGAWLWSSSPTAVATRVGQLDNVDRVKVHYVLPGQVQITVTERQPAFQVASNSPHPTWFSVDSTGMVLRQERSAGNQVPRIKLDQTLQVGQRLHPALMETCARVCAEVDRQYPWSVWYYTVDGRGNLSFRTFSREYPVDVQLGDTEGLERKLNILRALNATVMQQQRIASVDLRYAVPTVRLLHPPPKPVTTETPAS